jgi:hypothetical protein
MKTNIKTLFGGFLAFILLLLYTFSVIYIIIHVLDPSRFSDPTQGFIFVVNSIYGLISALVVASLAITKPGGTPVIESLTIKSDGSVNKWVLGLTWGYLVVWVIVGLAALVIGVMLFPDSNATLKDLGTSWLGLAIAAGFAWFGIKPQD